MARAMAWDRRALQTRMVYLGGLIGPFASQSLVAVVPEFAATFDKPVQHASFAVTAYMITLASTMLFSSALVRNVPPHVGAHRVHLHGGGRCTLLGRDVVERVHRRHCRDGTF